MNTLALHIEYLLLRHDCVIVPGLGAFLVHRDEARLEDGRRLLPPVRTLGFNSELTLNDGLLAGSVARRDSITYEAARQRIGQCVESFIHQLRESGTVPLGRLGTLSVSPESKGYIFEPAEDSFVANLPCLGLEPLTLAPVAGPSADEPGEPTVARPRLRAGFLARVAASAVLLCVTVGIVIATSGLSRGDRTDMASIGSALTSKAVEEPVAVSDIPVSRDILLNIALPAREPASEVREASPAGRYLLVVGSFPTQKAADKFIGGRAGLETISMDGNWRIYAATASTIGEARDKARELSSAYPSVWVCRR